MNQKIFHRGPDDDGFFEKRGCDFQIGMAMRRLSIIDLSTGKQPIYSEDGKQAIVFNGEIYNFLKLKDQLKSRGVEFKTSSDTEVILRLYQEFGTESFAMLDGMFAFSIFDEEVNKIYIARDFFGEKPLYYKDSANSFFWASELKSITSVLKEKPSLSLQGMNLYFRLTYIPAPFTIYEGISKLEANHFLEIDCEEGNIQKNEIEQNLPKNVDPSMDFEQAKVRTRELVMESIESRSIADVPLGTFLSGGVDSSIVSLALAQQKGNKIDTFSVGFEKKSFDETDKSRTVANLINSRHHEFIVSIKDLQDNIDNILLNFDEPFADSSSLPTYLVANKTRQYVKVALTGDGGDEVFGGYNKYYMGKLNIRYTSLVPENLHNLFKSASSGFLATKDDKRGLRFKLRRLINAVNYEGEFYYNIISLAYQSEEMKALLNSSKVVPNTFGFYKEQIGSKNKTLSDFRNIDKMISLEGDMLVKVDRTSMLTSLESRAPFLNKNLWNFTDQLPEKFLMNGWNKKFLLKEAFKKDFPKDFLNKSKKGFGIPVGDWLREHLSSELRSYIEPEFLKKQDIFNIPEITATVRKHLEGKEDNTFRVWAFFCFQKWYKEIYEKI